MRRRCHFLVLDAAAASVSFALAWVLAGPASEPPLFDNEGYRPVYDGAWIRLGLVGAAAIPALRIARLGVTPWIAPLLLAGPVTSRFGPAGALGLADPTVLGLLGLCVVLGGVGWCAWWLRVRSRGFVWGDAADVTALLGGVALGWWFALRPGPPPAYTPYVYIETWTVGCGVALGAAAALLVPLFRVARSRGAADVALWLGPLSLVWLAPWRWWGVAFGGASIWSAGGASIWSAPELRPHVEARLLPIAVLTTAVVLSEVVALVSLACRWSRKSVDAAEGSTVR